MSAGDASVTVVGTCTLKRTLANTFRRRHAVSVDTGPLSRRSGPAGSESKNRRQREVKKGERDGKK